MKPCNTNAWGFLASFAALTPLVAANADKIIFTGPAPITYPLASPSLSDLNLDALSAPSNLTLRTHLSRTFHDDSDPENEGKPRGQASWFLLDDLTQGQRYELRVCWAAIVSSTMSNGRSTQSNREPKFPLIAHTDKYQHRNLRNSQ